MLQLNSCRQAGRGDQEPLSTCYEVSWISLRRIFQSTSLTLILRYIQTNDFTHKRSSCFFICTGTFRFNGYFKARTIVDLPFHSQLPSIPSPQGDFFSVKMSSNSSSSPKSVLGGLRIAASGPLGRSHCKYPGHLLYLYALIFENFRSSSRYY